MIVKVSTVVVVALIVMVECGVCRANLIKVGGDGGWVPGTNYTEWSSQKQFYVGDWLYFVFNRAQYDVLEVNETVYASCNSQAGFITNVTRGGRDVFQLTEPRTYYFLCSRGYCWGGMKVAVHVHQPPPPSPAPAPAKSAAARSAPYPALSMLVAPAFALFFFFFFFSAATMAV